MIDSKTSQGILTNKKFIFFDCETANSNHEICQIGAIVVDENIIIEKIDILVKPKGFFEYNYVKKHGITPEMVKNEKQFDVVWNTYFSRYINEFVFVCHNAESADLPAICKSLQILNVSCPKLNYICTQKMSKKILKCDIVKFGLEDICDYFGYSISNHHNAFYDAECCMKIFSSMVLDRGAMIQDYIECFYKVKYVIKEIPYSSSYDSFEKRQQNKFSSKEVNSKTQNEEFDLDFAGQNITITGTFRRFPEREKLANELHVRGGKVFSSGNLAKSTTLLIAGDGAGKIEKAKSWGIRIVYEEELYEMLDNGNEVLKD